MTRASTAGALELTSFRVLSHTFLAMALLLLSIMRSSSDTCLHAAVDTPRAWNTQPLRDAPLVQVDFDVVRYAGSVVGSSRRIATRAPHALDDLEAALQSSRQACFQSSGRCQGVVTLAVDRRVESGVVKAILATAVRAGYPHHDFATERWVAMAN
jgi:hypothetical protein